MRSLKVPSSFTRIASRSFPLSLTRPGGFAGEVEDAAVHTLIQFPNMDQAATRAAADFVGAVLHSHQAAKLFFDRQRRRRLAAAGLARKKFAGNGGG